MQKLIVRRDVVLLYFAVALTASVFMVFALHLWDANLFVPMYFYTHGDEVEFASQIKTILLDGFVYHSDHLGAPFGADFFDYPRLSLFHQIVLRILLWIVPNAALVMNLYYLLGFPMVALAAFFTLRQLKADVSTSFVLSILYSLLPYHFLRNQSHYYYSNYFLVPLVLLICLWVIRGESLFHAIGDMRFRLTRRGIFSIVVCICISADNQIYALCSTVFLIAAAISNILSERKSLQSSISGAVLASLVVFGVIAQLVPTFIYDKVDTMHSNVAPYVRNKADGELYALTLAQLILPIQNHRSPMLASIRQTYDAQLPALVTENGMVSLGLLGALGFLVSLTSLLNQRPKSGAQLALHELGSLNLVAFVFATVGGISALVSYYITDNFRNYNRISPFIAFLSLAAVAIVYEQFSRKFTSKPIASIARRALLVLVLIGASLDQTSPAYVPRYDLASAEFNDIRDFDTQISARVSKGSAIFELPVVDFASGRVGDLGPEAGDEELIPSLLSTDLRWSGGTLMNSAATKWGFLTSSLPVSQMIEKLQSHDFGGIVIFKKGYDANELVQIESQIRAVTGSSQITNSAGTLDFFSIGPASVGSRS